MKRRAITIFWVCMAVILFAAGIRLLTKQLNPGLSYAKNKEFMENSEMYDILFLGNSHMTNAVYPMELWRDYGIASYNLAGYGNRIPTTYWMMENALDYSDPKLVVMDCTYLRMEEKVKTKELLHAQIDCFPLSVNKMKMICDLVEDPKERLEFVWDFAAYHDRWWDLNQKDFEKEFNVEKGAKIEIDVTAPQGLAERPAQTALFTSTGTDYLRRIIEECQRRDIAFLLVYLPYSATEEDWQEALCAEQIAEEYGVPYINFLDLQVVDLTVDSYDAHEHLNGSGGRKVTAYLGAYLDQHYDIADHRGEEAYGGWDEDYRRYTDYKLGLTSSLEALDKYLMMLSDPAFSCCVYINGEADVWQRNERYGPLVDNLSGEGTERLEEAEASGEDYFLVLDRQNGQIYECAGEESLQAECAFGQVRYETGEDGVRRLFLQGGEENYLHITPQGSEAAVQIIVIDRENGSIVDVKRFDNRMSVYTE